MENKEQIILELYEKIGFMFGSLFAFKNMLLVDKSIESVDDLSDMIIKKINDGNFILMFNIYSSKYGIKEAFDFFDAFFNKNNVYINSDDEEILCCHESFTSFYDEILNSKANISYNRFLSRIIKTYSASILDEDDDVIYGDERYFSDNIEKDYLIEIRKIPLLTPLQEKNAFEKLDNLRKEPEKNKEEIKEITNYIVEHNLRLVRNIARSFMNPSENLTLMDLIQEGNVGLINAVEDFEVKRGFKFSTYATFKIKQKIRLYIKEKTRTIRVPSGTRDIMYKIALFQETYLKEHMREATDQEVADGINISIDRLKEIKNASTVVASIDQFVGDKEDSTLGEFIKDETTSGFEEEIEDNYLYEGALRYLYELIKPEDKINNPEKYKKDVRRVQIIRLRYGIGCNKIYTLEEVGEIFNISGERVRQIEEQTIRELNRKHSNKSKTSHAEIREEVREDEKVDVKINYIDMLEDILGEPREYIEYALNTITIKDRNKLLQLMKERKSLVDVRLYERLLKRVKKIIVRKKEEVVRSRKNKKN